MRCSHAQRPSEQSSVSTGGWSAGAVSDAGYEETGLDRCLPGGRGSHGHPAARSHVLGLPPGGRDLVCMICLMQIMGRS